MIIAMRFRLSTPRSARIAALCLLGLAAPAAATDPNIVFFASGSASLDARGEAILDGTVQWLRRGEAPRVRLGGSADRVGSAAANRRLARRRAEAVRDALLRRGFPAGAIAVEAYGETRPLVETDDGIAEPQNRYVYIAAEIDVGAGTPRRAEVGPRAGHRLFTHIPYIADRRRNPI